jgi:hypothetical protein
VSSFAALLSAPPTSAAGSPAASAPSGWARALSAPDHVRRPARCAAARTPRAARTPCSRARAPAPRADGGPVQAGRRDESGAEVSDGAEADDPGAEKKRSRCAPPP